jgi:DNA modification methylase
LQIDLHNGDCLELMKDIPDGSVDLVLTDPPYGTTACKWDSVIPFEPMWEQLHRIIKPKGAICLFGSEPFSSALRMSNIKNYKYDWIWEKPQGVNPLLSKKQPLNSIENISTFYKKQCLYNPQYESGEPYRVVRDKTERVCEVNGHTFTQTETVNTGFRYPKRVLRYARENGNHPTQKPVALLEYLIRTYTNEGETVLDFTMGSGSTGVACVNTNRRFIGIELDEGYFDIAQKRIEAAQAAK